MRNFVLLTIVSLSLSSSVFTQHQNHTPPPSEAPIRLLSTAGFVHRRVSTKSAEAQKYFDQGLTLVYAYNDWDAAKSFKRATELDPNLAIAWWGLARTTMPGYDSKEKDAPEQLRVASDAIRKALRLPASAVERGLIEAFAKKFSSADKPDTKTLQAEYKNSMTELYKSFPDDPDVSALHALSTGWNWSLDGRPLGETSETVRILEDGLMRHPEHIGLNHFYIHTVEASQNPERGLRSANFLSSLKLKEPELGHLIHMPAHIYVRVGDFQKAAESNQATAEMVKAPMSKEFKEWHFYHVFSFLRLSYYMQGNYEKLRANNIANFDFGFPNPTADEKQMRGVDLNSMVRFRRWNDILKVQLTATELFPNLKYARAFALAATGKVTGAEAEYEKYLVLCKCGPDLTIPANLERWEADSFRGSVVYVSRLAAKIASAKGDDSGALEILRKAVIIEDQISYSEPPLSIEPVRLNLGGQLLRMGRFDEAEKTFREDLKRHRGNGRSLFGLMKALQAQNKTKEARDVGAEFRKAWRYSDTELSIEDL